MPTSGAPEGAELFVGRGREVGEFDGVRRRAVRGHGELVLLAGEAGVGKTRLVERVADRWEAQGFPVTWATCWEGGPAPPFWPWAQLLEKVTGSAALMLDDEAAEGSTVGRRGRRSGGLGSEALARFAMFRAVVAALRTAGSRSPQLFVIEDLHAADVASLELLSFVGPVLRSTPIVVAATYRTEDVDADHELGRRLPTLLRWGRQLVLSGLVQHEVAELMAGLTGLVPSDAAATAITDRTRGNPFFVGELVRTLEAPDGLEGITSEAPTATVPASVHALLRERMASLSADCRRILEAASVLGPAFGVDALSEVVGGEVGDVAAHADEAVAAHVFEATGHGRYGFTHGLFRDALYDGLGEARRASFHSRVGQALERLRERGQPIDASAVAHHFFTAAALTGEWRRAAIWCHAAGDHALDALAYEDAVGHYEGALVCLAHLPEGDRRRGDVLVALADAATARGDRRRARTASLEAMAVARASGASELLGRAAMCLASDPAGFEVALFDREQLAALEEASIALANDASPLRALILARRSVALSFAAPLEDRRALAEQALQVAQAAADQAALGYAMAAHCDAIAGPDDVDQRLVEAGEIITMATRRRDLPLQLLGRRLQLVAQLESGDLLAVEASVRSFAALAGELGQPLYEWLVPLWRGMQALLKGEVGACEHWLGEASALGANAASTNAAVLCGVQRWFLLTETGRANDALALLRDLIGSMSEPGTVQRVSLALGLGEARQLEDARAFLDATSPDELALVPRDSEWLPMLGELARAVAAVGGHPLAGWAYHQLLPYRGLFMVEGLGAVLLGSVEHHLGLLASGLGMTGEARAHFQAALAAHRRIGATLLLARTLRDAGRFLADQQMATDAAAIYGRLGLESASGASAPPGAPTSEAGHEPTTNVFRFDGDYWTIGHAGRVARLRDLKGLHDIARLLRQPGTEIHVLDLTTRVAPTRATTREVEHGEGHGDEVLDRRARDAYRSRIADLDAEIDDAEGCGDTERAARARAERDILVDQLTMAYGLGGRTRHSASTSERARSTVTRRVHDALRRIDRAHPELARHLRRSIKTGTFCMYEPDQGIRWET